MEAVGANTAKKDNGDDGAPVLDSIVGAIVVLVGVVRGWVTF